MLQRFGDALAQFLYSLAIYLIIDQWSNSQAKMKRAFSAWKTQVYHNENQIYEPNGAVPFNQSQIQYIKEAVSQEIAVQMQPFKNKIMKIYDNLNISQNEEILNLNQVLPKKQANLAKGKTKSENKLQKIVGRSEVKVETESSDESQGSQGKDSQYKQQTQQKTLHNILGENTLTLAKNKDQWESMYSTIKHRPTTKTGWSDEYKKNVVIFVDSGLKFGYEWKKLVQIAGVSQSSYKRWKKLK